MLFCTSLVALVGAGEQPAFSPRHLQIINTKVLFKLDTYTTSACTFSNPISFVPRVRLSYSDSLQYANSLSQPRSCPLKWIDADWSLFSKNRYLFTTSVIWSYSTRLIRALIRLVRSRDYTGIFHTCTLWFTFNTVYPFPLFSDMRTISL